MPPNGSWPFEDSDSVSRFGDLMHELMDSRYGGVAFLGAGASAPADFPTWAKFHEMFLEHFEAEPAASRGDSVPTMRNDFDYHTNRGEAKALAFIQGVFGGPVLSVPPVVKLVLRTRSLPYLFTTNFDEILFTAAAGAPVAVYPDYAPMDARFVYLHGRASSAESVNRALVLGDTGYRLAYRDLPGSPAKAKLQGLASYPVVFVGFSMTDPEVMGTLREMADAARRQQDDHGESILPLNWFAMLKAPSASDPGGAEWKRSTEKALQYAGVEAIWYQDGGSGDQHRALLDAAQRMQRESRGRTVAGDEPGFIDALQDAEALAAVTSPTSGDVRRAQAVLEGHPRIAQTFMGQVDGMEWFRHLRDARALEPKPSVRMANGARSAPYWLATDFLQRIASVAPAEVKDFLLTVDTDNWVAIGAAFDVLEALDEPAATELAETFARWTVSALADDSFTLARLTQAVRALESSAKQGAAFALARATLVELADSNPSVPEWSATGFGQAVTLILAKSADGITVATDALDAVLEREYVAPDQDKARYVRNTIEPHRTSLPAHSVLDLAIDVVRDTLLAAEDADSRAGAVAQLLRSPWPTERRIGIAHCFLRRADLPLHETAIITGENLANPHLFHELAKLLADDTSDLSEGSVRALKDFAAALHAEPSETGRYDYASWARIMPDDWLPEPFPAGDDDEDDPDRRLFHDVYFSGVFWPTAPLDQTGFAERAAELGSDDLLDLVRDPATAGVRVTWRHDPGPMWALLAEYAKGRDQLEPLLGIGPGDLRRERGISWPVIEALADIAGDSPERWADVLGWAVRMMSEVPSDEFWFLGVLLEKGGRIAPLAVSEGVRSLAMRVIEQAKRTGAVESELIDASTHRCAADFSTTRRVRQRNRCSSCFAGRWLSKRRQPTARRRYLHGSG